MQVGCPEVALNKEPADPEIMAGAFTQSELDGMSLNFDNADGMVKLAIIGVCRSFKYEKDDGETLVDWYSLAQDECQFGSHNDHIVYQRWLVEGEAVDAEASAELKEHFTKSWGDKPTDQTISLAEVRTMFGLPPASALGLPDSEEHGRSLLHRAAHAGPARARAVRPRD